ncbi:hypothetical protein [Streptomyces sp. RKAG290]|uniref:hypothetical protein n=1 Tax=Streptomyces sp. RKAG290 TaxID=2888348 RepID=UPI002033458E|nr:hypothetical protein [Streptomyces sp. RKAG290]MCM2413879.1 hypothetical protein [Streptomyces sp. RKAG290]
MSVRIRSSRIPTVRVRKHAAALAVASALAASLAGCSEATTPNGPGGDVPYVAPSTNASAAADMVDRVAASQAAEEDEGDATQAAGEAAANRPELVRDAFAGLQATYNDSCLPNGVNCVYFFGRVNDELASLDKAMKADDQGPAHFKEPLAWMSELRTTLAGDTSTANLQKNQKQLTGTRDRINTWMQGHPEDYR